MLGRAHLNNEQYESSVPIRWRRSWVQIPVIEAQNFSLIA